MAKGSSSRIRRLLAVPAALVVAGACAGLAGCSAGGDGGGRPVVASSTAGRSVPSAATETPAKRTQSPTPAQTTPAAPSPAAAPAADGPLKGKVVVVDPGHNIRNQDHPAEINRQVDIGTGHKECDTTGTSTDSGYPEATFSLDVAHRLRAILLARGASVVLTHDDDRPYGPCVDERAGIGNRAHGDAAVSVHADGAGVGDRGFHVILPAEVHAGRADTSPIVGPSKELGARIAGNFVRTTGSAPSNYIGKGTGLDTRGDLGGLNLSTIPKVFIECGNMRDPKDAALLMDADWREKAAQGIADGITDFLRG
ncbi:N-acetylmuramoyl-L-alanine amidase [Streptomyces sp. NPDC049577]|uniref:N-acetylmuramoyl-L-alanine amidase n=1 Tax=Streptomyces sp. NPDC049577 TaxID=3155153 RepID=UPI003412A494